MLFYDNSKFEHGNASNALVILESPKHLIALQEILLSINEL